MASQAAAQAAPSASNPRVIYLAFKNHLHAYESYLRTVPYTIFIYWTYDDNKSSTELEILYSNQPFYQLLFRFGPCPRTVLQTYMFSLVFYSCTPKHLIFSPCWPILFVGNFFFFFERNVFEYISQYLLSVFCFSSSRSW